VDKLEQIGFYTLSDDRAKDTCWNSRMQRCEILLTNRCNFKCKYCRGLSWLNEDTPVACAERAISEWAKDGLRNIRFSGGEPTFYSDLLHLVRLCVLDDVEHIAISTNGSRPFDVYQELIHSGVNDFSVSLDACCASTGDNMSGVRGSWERVVENIRELSRQVYVTVGVVLTEENIKSVKNTIYFAHELGVSDIRIISAAQFNELPEEISGIDQDVLDAHPILKYRIGHFLDGRNVRGIQEYDSHKCHLVKDDSVVAGKYHFPCVIYLREGGEPIGFVGENMRAERKEWFEQHNSFCDPICKKNCLDVCIDYNNKVSMFEMRRKQACLHS
jgi:pyruvate-formate lyase-activating enzyme